ncbi:hypothetical protein TSUD_16880 [Trifolium subterraneum]|uniref:Reverse transcriptase domain-containing protein n=1 Tax=Trifolium subterraneum TaxID=3900 RepID=A0A2Z6MQW1_TRISU|nr:hypothetical protein TSUD_16880 [Trifolium subterraneum]
MLWSDLDRKLHQDSNVAWCVLGDFNVVRSHEERVSRISRGASEEFEPFNHFINNNALIDLPLCGRKFTWYRGDGRSMSRLDRFLLSEDIPGYEDFVRAKWSSLPVRGWSGYILKTKLKFIKAELRSWHLQHTTNIDSRIQNAKNRLEALDIIGKERRLLGEEVEELHSLPADILSLSKLQASMQWQKSRVLWLKEGDANSKFFHGVMSSRRQSNTIGSLIVEGRTVDRVPEVRQAVCHHFSHHFQKKLHYRLDISGLMFKSLTTEDNVGLIQPFLLEEIKEEVWDCDSFKCPGPDGINIGFLKEFWDLLKLDFLNFFSEFYHHGVLTKGLNSTFIALIPKVDCPQREADFRPIALTQSAFIKGRQILDGILIANEIVDDAKRDNKELLMFKVDFEKAYDSVEWDYLDEVLCKMNFPCKWRVWMKECVSSVTASVLVNGSPTDEFRFERGLRQGDPLLPFLFLLAAEGLNVMMSAMVSNNMFTPYGLGPQNEVQVSHLQFADDTLLVGVKNWANVRALKAVLVLFESVSGLKVNFHKRWKCKNLSFGGRLILLMSVLSSILVYFLSFFKAPSGKWVWRCLEEQDNLWSRVLRAKYGQEGGKVRFREGVGSSWWQALNSVRMGAGLVDTRWLLDNIRRKVGDGRNTSFWLDPWLDDGPLQRSFSRLFELSENKEATVADMIVAGSGVGGEAWQWRRRLYAWEEELVGE